MSSVTGIMVQRKGCVKILAIKSTVKIPALKIIQVVVTSQVLRIMAELLSFVPVILLISEVIPQVSIRDPDT